VVLPDNDKTDSIGELGGWRNRKAETLMRLIAALQCLDDLQLKIIGPFSWRTRTTGASIRIML
jgi:hypothetical protein